MRRVLLLALVVLGFVDNMFGQLASDGRTFTGGPATRKPGGNAMNRSASAPTSCESDTSYFPSMGSTGYNSVTIRSGSALGQYFGAGQTLTVSGFRLYAYSIAPTPARQVYIRLRCNIYKAGADSLPTGAPLASDTITVDTVMGSSIPLARIERNAVFKKAVTLNYDYIITVECDSTAVSAALVTNSWANNDGDWKNLGCGSVSGKWYRCLQLNVGGVLFNADMQLYPFVKYNFGTDFLVSNDCYALGDTVKFVNKHKSNVSSQPYYNYYAYINLPQFSHRWYYDNSTGFTYSLDGSFRPTIKKNFNVKLISTVYEYSSPQCFDTTQKTIYFKPDRPSLKQPAMACIGDTVNLSLNSDAGATVNWYHKLSDPSPFFTGTVYKINNAQTSDTFYVQAVNSDCKSGFLKIEFTVSAYPNTPTPVNDSICSGAVANLGATTNIGKIEWFKAPTGANLLFVGNTLQTAKLYADTTFYVRANNNGCINKGGRVAVKAYVNNSFAPQKPQVVSDTFMCLRPSSSLKIIASQSGTDTLRWFNVPSGGKPIWKGDTFTYSPTYRGTETIYVETWNGICGSGRSSVNIQVSDYSIIYGLTGDTICPGETAYPYLGVAWGTANWYIGKSNPNPYYVGETPAFAGLGANTKFYMETEENGCASGIIDSVVVFVNAPPVPSSVTANSVCAKSIGSMTVNVPFGKVNWYYDPSDMSPFYVGNSVNAGLILGNVTYYYETEFKNCKSARQPLTVVMKPRPTAGFTWTLQWQHKLVCTPITTSGLTLTWYWGDGNTSTGVPGIHQYAAKGNYTVRLIATSTSNGCKDTADIPVVIDHTSVVDLEENKIIAHPNPVISGQSLFVKGDFDGNFQAELFSMDGKQQYFLVQDGNQIEIPSKLTSGIFILRIVENNRVHNLRILVGE